MDIFEQRAEATATARMLVGIVFLTAILVAVLGAIVGAVVYHEAIASIILSN